jgi:heparosan-N-sulfate-glucuronate 5-epimerase
LKKALSPRLEDLHISATGGSLSSTLGAYYLDMTSVIPLVESGFHGLLDDAGVPLVSIRGDEHVYCASTIAQYAIALHDAYLRSGRDGYRCKCVTQLRAIIAQVERGGERGGFFVHRWGNGKYERLGVPWVSALSQGTAISALLRGYQLLGDESLLEEAGAMFFALGRPIEGGGVRTVDDCGHLWFEEYPMAPPSHVLNGFIFALWGILDFARVTGDKTAWNWWQGGVETLRAHLREFDCGFWSLYDLGYRELASMHYHVKIHAPQLEAMYALTGEKIFVDYANRWYRFARKPRCRALWWLGLRLGALRRGWRFD